MADTTLTIRTEESLKTEASEVFASLGMNMSTAINMFLKQAVRTRSYPCSLDLDVSDSGNFEDTYPKDFFSVFGSGKDLDLDGVEEIPFTMDSKREELI